MNKYPSTLPLFCERDISNEKTSKETEGQIAFRFGEYISDEAFDLLCAVLQEDLAEKT